MDKNITHQYTKLQPSKQSSCLSQLFFCWALPLFYKRYKKEVTEEEHYAPLKSHRSSRLGDKLEQVWLKEHQTYDNPSLWTALWKTFYVEFLAAGSLFIFSEAALKMTQPWLIGKLLTPNNTTNTTIVTKNETYFFSFLLLVNAFLSVMIGHHYQLKIQHLGMKVRIATCSLIYRKVLKMNNESVAGTSVGKMVNLLTNDVNRFDVAPMRILQLFVAPFETFFVIICLWIYLGPTAILGIIFLVLFMPLQMYVGRLTSRFRSQTATKTDQRVKLMDEILKGIQVIKMYTWEQFFSELVNKARKEEIGAITKISYLKALNTSFMTFMNRTGIFLCILTYALTQEKIDAKYVFVVSTFYAILRQTLTVYFPFGWNSFSETRVSVDRIKKFLTTQEILQVGIQDGNQVNLSRNDPSAKLLIEENDSHLDHDDSGDKESVCVALKNVSVKWDETSPDYTLRAINFSASPSELVAIIGTVGSGKSSLINTILGELEPIRGQCAIRGRISYSSQEPWLFEGTIRQNILFGAKFDGDRYHKIIRICGLEDDLAIFPNGDGTLVGERGVLLSGGQKARINLARAVYKEADIYLLDDPFAAVDTKVGKTIFQECVLGFLKNKCTILITHHLHYLGSVARIYRMEQGKLEHDQNFNPINEDGLGLINDEEKATVSFDLDSPKNATSEAKEERSSGNVSKKVYKKYTKAGGNWLVVFLLLLMFIFAQCAASGADYFLAFWVNIEESSTRSEFFTHETCIYIYSGIIGATILIPILRSIGFFKFCINASTNLHQWMLSSLIQAPLSFFQMNPSGRVLNRFSKDLGLIDEQLPVVIMDTIQIGFVVLGSTLIITFLDYWMLIPTVLIFVKFYFFRIVFLASSRNLKRLEATRRSPVYSHVTTSFQGLTTIRSYKAQNLVKNEFDYHQDRHSSAFYMFMVCNRAFGFWLDMSCVFYTIVAVIKIIISDTSVGNIGLGITQSLNIIGVFQWGIRQWSELENQMISVERVDEYTRIPPENVLGNTKPPLEWPSQGQITFKGVVWKHTKHIILDNISFSINPPEKIGIVGRTGAGKSSLVSALFHLVDYEGYIIIDGVDVATIPLNSLRSKISIIPQEPTLFSGTIRHNLDPFWEFSDHQIWKALEQVEMKNVITNLDLKIAESGANFSVGQKQLICLARAILRNNKILIMDEATASVDPETDLSIQKTIKTSFDECTVVTVAHRLHTVMESDRVLVMDSGKVVEFEHPHALLQNSESLFAQLVKESGKEMAQHLTNIAEEDYHQRDKI